MSAGQFGRLMSIGTNWTTARLCWRWTCADTGGNLVAPDFYFGFCSGTAAMVGDANTTNFIGMRLGNGSTNWNRTAGPPPCYGMLGQWPMKKVGSTITTPGSIGASTYIMADPNYRACYMLEIAKGSPNWNVKLFSKTGSAAVDITQDQFLDYITTDNPTVSGHQFWGGTALAFDEVAGPINAINMYWDKASPVFEISDVAVVRIA